MVDCKICGSEFKNLKSLSQHFNLKHNINAKEYYDKFLKKENDGKCSVCGKPTTYRNMGTGYLNNCSIECRSLNKNIKRDSLKGRTQSKETIQKRIKNTDQKLKQKNLEESNLKKYGVKHTAKLDFVKNKMSQSQRGSKKERNYIWQKNIIDSKRKNGTLKHSIETKTKISNGLNEHFKTNFDREKYISTSNNVRHLNGWYNGLYFRSSLELSFLFNNNEVQFKSCETKKYSVIYSINNKNKIYYPDYTDGKFIYEIKPFKILDFGLNPIKIKSAKEKFGDLYKVITEKECEYIPKETIKNLIKNGRVVLVKNSEKVFEKYNH